VVALDEAPSRSDLAAASVGARDLFVLRRVAESRFVHFGGSGRGAGWAGLIEVRSDEVASLGEALATRRPVRLEHAGRELVFGPYYAHAAAIVPVTNDVVVVLGADGDELADATDDALASAATSAADAVESISPVKRLADELEELEAVRAAVAVETSDLVGAIRSTALVAAESLSCELAVVYLAEGGYLEIVERGWNLTADRGALRGAFDQVLADGRLPCCVQDANLVPLPPPLDREQGIRSYYLLELHGAARGVLFVAHTDGAPRGFTLLCRRLGLRLGAVASFQLAAALTQEWCRTEAARLHAEFGKLDAP
jgi:hypothetical protein